MKTNLFNGAKLLTATVAFALIGISTNAQTTIYQTIQASPAHTILEQAIDAVPGLSTTLDGANADLTVFAPDDDAFNAALDSLGITAGDLLSDPNLADILEYHVLAGTIGSGDLSNGLIETPLNNANTVKFTINGTDAYINQSLIDGADIPVTNGALHSMDQVIFANETVADIAIDSPDHSTLVAAVIEARLLPALTHPFLNLTVFAPTDAAFTEALDSLGITAGDLLADPTLPNTLLYHVLGFEVQSGDLFNGAVATPLNTANTVKVTIDGTDVFVNHAQVTSADNLADNGVVHVLGDVILPVETVADVAIDSPDHTTLVAAVVEARLLPALTNPFAEFTLFAPTNAAFTQFLTDEGITAGDLLASPDLADILLYHALGSEVLSTDLTNGSVTTLNGADIVVDLSNGVMINSANVTGADNTTDNGVVHVIDYVLNPAEASIEELTVQNVEMYPNPATSVINVKDLNNANYSIVNMAGAKILSGSINGPIAIDNLQEGTYFINITDENNVYRTRFIKM